MVFCLAKKQKTKKNIKTFDLGLQQKINKVLVFGNVQYIKELGWYILFLKDADVQLRFNSCPGDLLWDGGQHMIGVWCTAAVYFLMGMRGTVSSYPTILTSIHGLQLFLCFISASINCDTKHIKPAKSLLPHQPLSFLCGGRSPIVTSAMAVAIAVVIVDVGG